MPSNQNVQNNPFNVSIIVLKFIILKDNNKTN